MDDRASIRLTRLTLKNFRCFSNYTLEVDSPHLLIEGVNGVGKTSILEALYYTCYLRSFRTHIPKELISFGKDGFFIKVDVHNDTHAMSHTIQIGLSSKKRVVKVDQKQISSYKELMAHYRIVSVTEDDLALVQASPNVRRVSIDQLLVLLDPSIAPRLKTYKQILDQRNALLQHRSINTQMYTILTGQLWQEAEFIANQRILLLERVERLVNEMGIAHIPDFDSITFSYSPKRHLGATIDEFNDTNAQLYEQERRFSRTLFGAHLDDYIIHYHGKRSRLYASRGQQKLIVLLVKMAHLKLLYQAGIPGICLLDDFMTDFDPGRAESLLSGLSSLGTQLIFTSPIAHGPLVDQLAQIGAQRAQLTI